MRLEDIHRLEDMLQAAKKAVAYCRSKTRSDLDQDELLALAMVRLIEVVGEAARSVGEDTRGELAAIPWRQVIGTRDRLIHGYGQVDLDIVWSIITDDPPVLIRSLETAGVRKP
jgi:uncharacterized protein with HEPN domain